MNLWLLSMDLNGHFEFFAWCEMRSYVFCWCLWSENWKHVSVTTKTCHYSFLVSLILGSWDGLPGKQIWCIKGGTRNWIWHPYAVMFTNVHALALLLLQSLWLCTTMTWMTMTIRGGANILMQVLTGQTRLHQNHSYMWLPNGHSLGFVATNGQMSVHCGKLMEYPLSISLHISAEYTWQ